MALTWDDVTALTNRAVKKKLQMAWKNAHVLALKLTREGRKKPVMQPYGDGVRFPIMYQASGNATWYTKGTPLPAATTAQLTASQFDYKFLACQAAVDGTELIRNTGPNGVVNLVEGIKANSMASLEDALGTAVYSDGTDSLRVNGVRDLIASATYGNIATADFAGWAAAKDYSSTSNLTLAQLDDIWTAAADGSDAPTIGLTRPSVFSKLRSLLTPQERYQEDGEARKYGFRSLMFNGTPIFMDRYCPGSDGGTANNQFFFLNEDYLEFFIHPDRNFVVDEPIRPVNQDARVYPILLACNIGCNRRDRHSRWSNIDPNLP